MSRQFILEVGNKKILFMHGHEIDPYNQGDDPPKGQAVAIIAAGVEDVVGGSRLKGDRETVENRLHNMAERVMTVVKLPFKGVSRVFKFFTNGSSQSPSQSNNLHSHHIQSTALLKEKCLNTDNEFDYVVMGHTHYPGQLKWYNNTGSWAGKVPTFLEIDLEKDGKPAFRYYEWKDGRACLMEDPALKV